MDAQLRLEKDLVPSAKREVVVVQKINLTKRGGWVLSQLILISCPKAYARASFSFFTTHGHQ